MNLRSFLLEESMSIMSEEMWRSVFDTMEVGARWASPCTGSKSGFHSPSSEMDMRVEFAGRVRHYFLNSRIDS